ncbi:MAG: twin-arginine translocase TatA/TatE family subunit [Nitrospinota bacterium]
MIGGFGVLELLLILAIVLVLFGASRLPELGRGLGEGIRLFRRTMRASDAIDVTPPPEDSSPDRRS